MDETARRTPEKYPLLARVYGVLCIIASVIQVIAFVLGTLILVAIIKGIISGEVDLSELSATGHTSMTTIVISAVAILVSAALAVMFFILGIRLLRGRRHETATLANIMIALEAVGFVCVFMLEGLSRTLVFIGVNTVILIILEAYSDPSLRQERVLQRRLQQLEDRAAQEEGTLGRDTTGKGYITLNYFNIFWIFVVCCFLGLILEIIWHMVVVEPGVYEDRAGLLFGPFSPIYGFGAVLMSAALNRYYNKSPLLVFLVAGLIGAAFEFFVSWFLETAFGIIAWDYSDTFLNIGGRTNFMFFCIWGLLGLAWVRCLMPILLKLVNKVPWNWRYSLTAVATALMLVDCILTLAAFDCWYQRADGTMDYERQSAIVAFCNEHYTDEFMEDRFQSMTMTAESSSRA